MKSLYHYLKSCYKIGKFGPWSIRYLDWSPLTEKEIKRTHELAKIYGWK